MSTTNLEMFKKLFKNELENVNNLVVERTSNNLSDELDVAAHARDLEIGLKLATRNSIYMKKITEALTRIDNGEFGICQECGDEISLTRLMARPTATMCSHCKEETEREENHILYAKKSHSNGFSFQTI